MKIKIPKSRITAPIDFGEAISSRRVYGVDLSYTEYGFIQIPSKKVALFDAYSASGFKPLNAECGVVAFPFYCGCMTDDGERVAYAGLRFNEEKAVKWEIAVLPDDLSKLVHNADAAAIAISSGVCCLCDSDDYKLYRAHINDEVHPLAGLIVLNGETHTTVKTLGKSFAVFSSGWGDGCYKCYKGLAADGSTTAIIIDFGMIEYPDDGAEIELDIDCDYVYDPSKSDKENNIARWTVAVEHAKNPTELLDALSRRGYARHAAGDSIGALEDYAAAIATSKSVTNRRSLAHLWSVYDNAAELYIARGDYDRAISVMTTALGSGDDCYAGAYVRLIDLYLLTEQAEKAKAVAEQMKSARRDDATAVMKYAECCVATGDFRAAAKAYGELADEFRSYESLFDAASCYIELGEYDNALSSLENHPAKEGFEQYWYYKAKIEFDRRNFSAAKEYAARAREIEREYVPALKLLIEINSLLQENFVVAGYAEEYKRLVPADEYGYTVCAYAQLLLGNYSECARNYYYAFHNVDKSDRNAALAAVACRAAGDNKRSNRMLKFLRRKHSPYYIGAVCGEIKPRHNGYTSVVKSIIVRLKDDRDFLVRLSAFMCVNRSKINYATPLLEILSKSPNCEFAVVALQIRAAVVAGNKAVAGAFFDYYLTQYMGEAPAEQIDRLKRAFGLNG
ncbi:MAG: DUF4241 domain-containing protein [Clostridiales bacterium]|nr:DUF4241 domain-containing protein [Clostridiales bacterium]